MSQITTHILDTSKGKPASGVAIRFEKKDTSTDWLLIANGNTNEDGRISDFIKQDAFLAFGVYRLVFDSESYYKSIGVEGLYPSVSIEFRITENKHYHIPLLLNPFGYSTYRGS